MATAADRGTAAPPPDQGAGAAPTGFVLGSATQTPFRGSSGGVAYQDRCPDPDQVAVGFQGTMDSTGLNSVQVVCGRLTLTRSATTYVVGIAGGATLPVRGNAGGTAWTSVCPAGAMVTGIDGRSGSWIDLFRAICAPLTMAADGRSVARGSETILPAHGDPTGGNPFSDRCAGGQVATGGLVRAGLWVDGLNLFCAPVTPSP